MSKGSSPREIAQRYAAMLPILCALGASAIAQSEQVYLPEIDARFPTNLYWGDTHLHTRNSPDAFSLGNMNLSPADAYRFARGQELRAQSGMRVRLRRPLDFLVVSDHSEYLGGHFRLHVGDKLVAETEIGQRWRAAIAHGDSLSVVRSFSESISSPETVPAFPKELQREIWREVAITSDEYYQPGVFTTLTGYEWTAMKDGNNLHRVVVFADGAEKAAQFAPFTSQQSVDPQDLWRWLAKYESKTGGQAMAIPHNGNLSNGSMFPDITPDGEPLTLAYAELSSRWEPVYEVTQVKGDSESHPTLSPQDEFADFENWDENNIGMSADKEDWMLVHEYARSALKLGLKFENQLGVNPYKFGLIGSTDGHNTFSTTEEDNFWGKFADSEPGAERLSNQMASQLWLNWKILASGYAAVWARENTREEIFAALKRREVYATTGSRILVRMFAGWHYPQELPDHPNAIHQAYLGGVPMGGDLSAAPEGRSPRILLLASKDPIGANLDRVQVIKGWQQKDGSLAERVYDVVWSGDRQPDAETGALPPVGSTVDAQTATYLNTIGARSLAAVWIDPDFDPTERAFYYARVIEIPRPRWTTYDAVRFGVEPPEGAPLTIQDRAYTSPIWYSP